MLKIPDISIWERDDRDDITAVSTVLADVSYNFVFCQKIRTYATQSIYKQDLKLNTDILYIHILYYLCVETFF